MKYLVAILLMLTAGCRKNYFDDYVKMKNERNRLLEKYEGASITVIHGMAMRIPDPPGTTDKEVVERRKFALRIALVELENEGLVAAKQAELQAELEAYKQKLASEVGK